MNPLAHIALLLVAATLFVPAAVAQPAAGTLQGTVASIEPNGKYLHLKVEKSDPDGLAALGDEVRIMANWGPKEGGGIAPKPADTQRILAYSAGQSLTLPVKRDKKQTDAFRLASEAAVDEAQEQARIQRETMYIPTKWIETDASVITGADEQKLEAMAGRGLQTIRVAAGEDIAAAMQKAADLLEEGQGVHVKIEAGRYAYGDREVRTINLGGGKAKDAPLVIEGAGPESTVIDFQGSRGNRELLNINQKHHLVMRGVGFVNHGKTPIVIGKYAPVQDNADFLIENCHFNGNGENGLTVFHVDGITLRNLHASDNGRTGVFLIARNCIVDGGVFTGNKGAGPGSFKGGIALAARDTLIRGVTCDNNPGPASGLRMDHAAENVIIENSTFNGNGSSGQIWETAKGPVAVRDSEIRENGRNGVVLATAYHFTFDGCTIANNGEKQFEISAKPRPVVFIGPGVKSGAYGASDFTVPVGKSPYNLVGMMGNHFLRVTHCTIESQNVTEHPFFGHQYGRPDIYKNYFTEQYEASGNTYRSPDNSAGFDTFQGPYSAFELVTLEQWQQWTGEEDGSTWEQVSK